MRRILFLLILFLSFPIYANDYFQWYWGTNQANLYPSAVAACAASSIPNQGSGWKDASHAGVRLDFPSSGFCLIKRTRVSDGYQETVSTHRVTRIGSSCEEGKTYNPQTGECESDDPCGDKLGDEFNFSISGVGSTDYMFISESGQFSAPSQTGCFNGCSASTVDQSCQVRSLGPWRCGGVAVYTGAECGQGGITIENSDTLDKPVSELTTDSEPCNYITGPGGEQTCTSVQTEELRGQTCGTFNGETICPEIQPELESIQIDTTVTTEDNGDGTTTTTKVDTATVTSCTGASCNTTTTTNTTVNNNGNITSSCTGPRCATGSNPDGNGDGFGDGDGGVIGQPGLGEFGEEVGEFSDSVDAFMNRVSDAPVMSALDSIGGSAPAGNCSIGATSVWFFEFDAGPIFCDMAPGVLSPLYPLFLAIWAFAAVRILFSA